MNIHSFNYKYLWQPPNHKTDKTLLLLHGPGGNEEDFLELGKVIAPNFNLLSVKGKIAYAGNYTFFKKDSQGYPDAEDLNHRAIQFSEFIRLARLELIGPSKVIVLGYSEGATLAVRLAFQDPQLISGIILLRPIFPPPEITSNLNKLPSLIVSGLLNQLVSLDDTERFEALFLENNAQLTSKTVSSGNGLSSEDFKISKEWLRENFS